MSTPLTLLAFVCQFQADMREPLSIIIFTVQEMLENEKLSSSDQKRLKLVLKQTDRLRKILSK